MQSTTLLDEARAVAGYEPEDVDMSRFPDHVDVETAREIDSAMKRAADKQLEENEQPPEVL